MNINDFDENNLRKPSESREISLGIRELLTSLSCSDPCACSFTKNDRDIVTMNYNDYS
jgi:hypothetical protein